MILDKILSVFFIVAASPLILAISVLIKLTSRGPVLIRQVRVGKGGKEFLMYKFRSMKLHSDDEAHKQFMKRFIAGQLKEEDKKDGLYKLSDDSRITRVGKFIRAFGLDEIPQFLNVLKGEMSIVGPRPAMPYEIQWYKDWQKKRMDVLPGITGLWQVSGRNKMDFDAGMRRDLDYINERSLWLDVKIMFVTVRVMLFGRER